VAHGCESAQGVPENKNSRKTLTVSYRSQWDNEESIWRYVQSPAVQGGCRKLTFVQMLTHAGLLDMQEAKWQLHECQQEPERAWEEWKGSEAKSRYVSLIFCFMMLLLTLS
jgi:hypothetical protein